MNAEGLRRLRDGEIVPRSAMRQEQAKTGRAWCTECDAGSDPRWAPLTPEMYEKFAALRVHARTARHKVVTEIRTHRSYQPTKGEIRCR